MLTRVAEHCAPDQLEIDRGGYGLPQSSHVRHGRFVFRRVRPPRHGRRCGRCDQPLSLAVPCGAGASATLTKAAYQAMLKRANARAWQARLDEGAASRLT